jgi:hypothetical protein
MPKPIAALLAAVLTALTLAACGGGDSSPDQFTSTSATRPSTAGEVPAKERTTSTSEKGKGGKSQKKGSSGGSGAGGGGGSGASSGSSAVPPLKVSGGGSSQFRTKGGDNSIQNYGEESDETELRQAAEALHGFYIARAEEEWTKACSYLAKTLAKQLEQLASRSPQLKGGGCPEALHAVTRPLPPSVERETTLVDAASLRREGEGAFLIYRGAEGKVYAVSMQQEGGGWKVAGLAGTPLD